MNRRILLMIRTIKFCSNCRHYSKMCVLLMLVSNIGKSGSWFEIQKRGKYQIFNTYLESRQICFFNDLPQVESMNHEAAKLMSNRVKTTKNTPEILCQP